MSNVMKNLAVTQNEPIYVTALIEMLEHSNIKKLTFIIGASGAGKTTAIKALEMIGLPGYRIVYFDSIGVPPFEEMNEKYGGPEEWQRVKTKEWVRRIKEQLLSDTHVILDGQTRPKFIEESCVENKVSEYVVILFDCSDEERIRRLVSRGQSELANQNMMNWAKYLRDQCQKLGYKIIDNTHLNQEETLNKLFENIKE